MAKDDETPRPKKAERVSLALQVAGVFLKLKRCVDGLVDAYCRLTRIEPAEAKEVLAERAASLMKKGQYGKAIDRYNKLIGMGEKDASTYYSLAICCEREGMDEEAQKAFEKALEIDKDHRDAAFRLALLALKRDDAQTAAEHLTALAATDGESFEVLYHLGVAHDKLKDYESAVEDFKKAIAIEPTYVKAHKRLGYTYDAMGSHENAVACFKKAMGLEEL